MFFQKLKCPFTKLGSAHLSGVKTHVNRVLDMAQKSEARFLESGNNLMQVSALCREIMDSTTALTSRIRNTEGESVGDALERVFQEALGVLESHQSLFHETLQSGDELINELRELNECGRRLGSMALFLKVSAFNIQAESARSAMAQEMFLSFSQELKKLAEEVSQLADTIFNDSHLVERVQVETTNSLHREETRLSDYSLKARNEIRVSLQEMTRLMDLSADRGVQVSDFSSATNESLNQLIHSMQFQDITSQQIHHICEAILKGMQDYECRRISGGEFVAVCAVQEAQLDRVSRSLDELEGNLVQQMEGIIVAMNRFGGRGDMRSGQHDNKAARALIEKIIHNIDDLGNSMEMSASTVAKARASANSSAEKAAQLASSIEAFHGLSLEMKLKSLNAIIKSIHLGEEGRSLEVLANKVTEIAGDSQVHIESVINSVTKVSEYSNTLICLHSGDAQIQSADRASIKSVIAVMNEILEMEDQSAEKLKPLMDQIQRECSHPEQLLNYLSSYRAEIDALRKGLKKLIDQNQRSLRCLDQRRLEELRAQDAHYTMELERGIHQDALSTIGSQQQNNKVSAAALTAGVAKAADDNVEFF
jgi:hypothetical protein